ncbi:conserved hypothetical protein [Mesorhizobium sp. STM 4661]|nr:conserved hypothetical protein [Mesorhizobium sp. STM 4661]
MSDRLLLLLPPSNSPLKKKTGQFMGGHCHWRIVNQRLLLFRTMTKNLGNAQRNIPRETVNRSLLSRLAPALFPLAVVALGYMIGRQFFGF